MRSKIGRSSEPTGRKRLIEEQRDEIVNGRNLRSARVALVSRTSSKLENYSARRWGGWLRGEEDPGAFFTGLIFLIFLESRRYAGTVRRKLQSSIGELRDVRVTRWAKAGGRS